MRWGVVVVTAVMLLLGPATSATAYVAADNPPPQSITCAVAATGAAGAAVWNARTAAQLTPASAVVGAPVTLTVPASSAPTFAVASSAALLATPDLAAGVGVPAPTPGDYTFTTTFTTPGTVYWSAALPVLQTAGCPPFPDTSIAPIALTVMPPPPPPPPPPVRVAITVPSVFRLPTPSVSYAVACSASCTGDTYFEASITRNGRVVRESHFDLDTSRVLLAASGQQRFTRRYSAALGRLIRRYGPVQLELSAKVTDANGNVVRAQAATVVTD